MPSATFSKTPYAKQKVNQHEGTCTLRLEKHFLHSLPLAHCEALAVDVNPSQLQALTCPSCHLTLKYWSSYEPNQVLFVAIRVPLVVGGQRLTA